MTELTQIEIGPGLTFDVLTAGAADAPLVLLLHGFAESFHMWHSRSDALAAAGYRAVAPSQRGYSPGARPDTAEFSNYEFDRLVDDAMAIAGAAAAAAGAFIWSGTTGAAASPGRSPTAIPERLASLTILSRPHPIAFNRALEMPDGEQKRRSAHHKWFLESDAVAAPARRRRRLAARTPQGQRRSAGGDRAAHRGDRQRGRDVRRAGVVPRARHASQAGRHHRVPTLYIWGDADDTVGRAAAEGTAEFVSAPYRFEVLPGGGHFTADQFPDRVNALVLAHLAGASRGNP